MEKKTRCAGFDFPESLPSTPVCIQLVTIQRGDVGEVGVQLIDVAITWLRYVTLIVAMHHREGQHVRFAVVSENTERRGKL